MYKKLLSTLLAAVMMCTLLVPAFADTVVQTEGDNDVVISTDSSVDADGKNPEQFTVVIPADPAIVWGTAKTDLNYSVESHFPRNKTLNVTVTATADPDGITRLKTADEAYSIPFTLSGETAYVAPGPVVYEAATKTVSVNIAADDWNRAVVDTYSAILTFGIDVAVA